MGQGLGGASTCLLIATAGAIVSYIPIGQIASKIGRRRTIQGGIVQLWINHGDTDQVTQGLLQLRAAFLYQDELEALEAFDACMENFGHLHHRDAFTLKNIL